VTRDRRRSLSSGSRVVVSNFPFASSLLMVRVVLEEIADEYGMSFFLVPKPGHDLIFSIYSQSCRWGA
jgi:hypothetical protein